MVNAGPYFKLTRFPLVFTAMADSAVGAALVGVNLLTCVRVIPAVAASACLYAAGMVMNDICDLERDRALHSERPLPSGRISRKGATTFAATLFALALASAAVAGLVALLWAVGVAILVMGYDALFKRNDVTGSLGMAAVRAANLGLGAVAVGASPASAEFPWLPAAVLAVYVFLLTLWSTREDRPGEGRGFMAIVGAGMAWAPLAGALRPVPFRWPALLPAVWIAPWILRAIIRPEPGRRMQVVRWGVLGIILVDASFLAALGRWTEAGVVAGLILPALALLPLFRRL